MEDLIEEINKNKLGIKIGEIYVGIIMYADDILLLADTKGKMQKLLKIVENYGKKWEIKFNPVKTVYMELNKKVTKIGKQKLKKITKQLIFDKQPIEEVKTMKYLGMMIRNDLKNVDHIEERQKNTSAAFYKMQKLGVLSSKMSFQMKIALYKVYCRTVLLYGVENTYLTKAETKKIQTIESCIIKRLFSIKKSCKTTDLLKAISIDKLEDRLKIIKTKYYKRLMDNPFTNQLVHKLIQELCVNKIHKKSFIRELLDKSYLNANDLSNVENVEKVIKAYISQYKEYTEASKQEMEMDSIRKMLQNNEKDKLNELLKSY